MNNNRNNNNRRRGRGGNRGGGGNPMQGNRIDSRARGNAPQMLDKYKKLAHDAAMNDDRVQTEYYLQFADHYFRVIADSKAQKDEQQAKRQSDRDERDDDGDEDENQRQPRRNQRQPRRDDDFEQGQEGESGDQADDDTPFTPKAKSRKPKADKPKSDRPKSDKPRRKKSDETIATNDGGLDPSMLPPAIARGDDSDAAEKPKRATRARRPRDEDDDSGPLKAVG